MDIRKGILQGDSISPLLFILCMISLTLLLLRKVKVEYEWYKKHIKLNHLLFMDDLKLFGKGENEINSLAQTVHVFSKDIGMEFGMKKCGMLLMNRGKVVSSEGIELSDGEVMKDIEENGYKYLGVIEYDRIKETEMKESFGKEYERRLKLVLKSKLNGKNKIKAINVWAVSVMRYGAGIINWNKEEIQKMDRKTRKIMTMNGALHPKSDVDRIYLPRGKGGRGLVSCENYIKSEENSLGMYVKDSPEPLLQGVRLAAIIDTAECISKEDFKRKQTDEREKAWREKKMYGQFLREIDNGTDKLATWEWLRRSDLKIQTEALIFAAQEQALRTNYVSTILIRLEILPMQNVWRKGRKCRAFSK